MVTALRPLHGLVVIDEVQRLPDLFSVLRVLADRRPKPDAAFWATHQGAEIDLVLRWGDRLFGVECKRADAPRLTPSIRIALHDLGLEGVAVVYPGDKRYPIADRVKAVPLSQLVADGTLFDEDNR